MDRASPVCHIIGSNLPSVSKSYCISKASLSLVNNADRSPERFKFCQTFDDIKMNPHIWSCRLSLDFCHCIYVNANTFGTAGHQLSYRYGERGGDREEDEGKQRNTTPDFVLVTPGLGHRLQAIGSIYSCTGERAKACSLTGPDCDL